MKPPYKTHTPNTHSAAAWHHIKTKESETLRLTSNWLLEEVTAHTFTHGQRPTDHHQNFVLLVAAAVCTETM